MLQPPKQQQQQQLSLSSVSSKAQTRLTAAATLSDSKVWSPLIFTYCGFRVTMAAQDASTAAAAGAKFQRVSHFNEK
jgi:hypothetical protein